MKTLTIDIETTGLPPKGADYKVDYMNYPYIVSLAYKINDEETKEFIINQEGRKIPSETIIIHGITDEMADNSPYKIYEILRDMIIDAEENNFSIGHNIYFDSSIIKANVLRGMKIDPEYSPNLYPCIEDALHKDKRIDTMRLGQKICGGKWPKLTELHMKLFGFIPKESHKSGADVDTAYKCYLELVRLGIAPAVNHYEINGTKLDNITIEEES